MIAETIKGWVHKDIINDLPKLNEGKGSRKQLVLIIVRSFKSVLNQVWINRYKKFYEWEQSQNIQREYKKKTKFKEMRKMKVVDYDSRKIELINNLENRIESNVRSLLISVNNFSLIVFGIDNGRA